MELSGRETLSVLNKVLHGTLKKKKKEAKLLKVINNVSTLLENMVLQGFFE